jgi:UDP-N-acetylmuramoylalanine-D-glutamate ligase
VERAEQLRRLGVEVVLGGDGTGLLADTRVVVKSPGIPPEIPPVAEALRRGLELLDELEVGWHLVPSPVVAVTGTNGKSTVAGLCVSVLAAHGLAPVLCGNTEFGPPLSELTLGAEPRTAVAEVSSYQTEFSRSLSVDAAIFTNLTRDHVNRHRTMEEYAAAKRALFVRDDWAVPLAAVNVDDDLGRTLAGEIEARGGLPLRYGEAADASYRILDATWSLREAEVLVDTPDGKLRVRTALPGLHNAANVTAVLALADGLGLPRERTLTALAAAAPVPGRFEVVDVGRPFDVVVDFAYVPDSVASVLQAARTLVSSRGGRLLTVLTVVGRAGAMVGREVGAEARRRSDHLVVSGTSYRGEPRIVALAELAAGARSASGGTFDIVIDRREAIGRALSLARPGDLVMILGRGPTTHEATDARGGFRPLDDRQVARELA